nr:zinc finger, CCHC-type [Tanacetum cinerariifolium]
MDKEYNLRKIKKLTSEVETLQEEKDVIDGKLARLLKSSKDLEDIIESHRSENVKEGVGYNVVPPPAADLYHSPKKDLSWTGLPKFADDTVTDYSRPTPTVESTSAEGQNKHSTTAENVRRLEIRCTEFLESLPDIFFVQRGPFCEHLKFLDTGIFTKEKRMTTSVGNNSVFKSFFEKQKLTGPNFIDWYRQIRLVLSTEDKENYLEHHIPVAPVAPPGQQVPPQAIAAHAAWVKGQKEELKAMCSKQAEQELLQTVREFHTCKQAEGQSVSSHVLKMKGYIDNLERLGQPVGKNLAVSLILVSLNKDFDSFVQNYNMHGKGKTVNELHAMLKLHKESLPKKDVNPSLHAIRAGRVKKNQKNKPHKAAKGGHGKGKGKTGNASSASKPKTPPPPKKDNPTKDAVCHQCGEIGHWRRNCPVYLAELMKKKKLSQGASTSGIFTIELYSFPSKSWIYDTGCGTHICITTQGLRRSKKLKPGALSLYVGDGHRTAVEAIETYHLELPSGLVIVLNNCHYAPSITRGVISVSRLFDDGFVNRFDENNVIPVSKNNLVYFMAVPWDSIYEIDMTCTNTNDSSMYAITDKRAKINLVSSLLWHCRLGHISMKRIKKLQHDRLLNSIDIESLGKCVS